MGRIRTVKPDVAKHELLFELEQRTSLPIRFTWVMLPTICDREGRFKWRPLSMKTDVLPYDRVEFESVLSALLEAGQVVKYRHGSEWFGWVPTFTKHQRVSPREDASELPALIGAEEVVDRRPMGGIGLLEGKGMEGNGSGEWKGTEYCTEPPIVSAPAFLEFPITGSKDAKPWALVESLVVEFEGLFPGLDVRAEMRKALAWVTFNPGRRKTARGMPRFLSEWLIRSQDRGGARAPTPPARSNAGPPEYTRWECPHVEPCADRGRCRNATILGRPVKKAAS